MARDLDEVMPPAPGYPIPRRPIPATPETFAPPPKGEDPRQLVNLRRVANEIENPVRRVAEIVAEDYKHGHLMEMAKEITAALTAVHFNAATLPDGVPAAMQVWIVAGVLDEWAKSRTAP